MKQRPIGSIRPRHAAILLSGAFLPGAAVAAQEAPDATAIAASPDGYAPICRSPSSRDPSWAPDGQRIFFSSDRSGTQEIWSMGADGSDVRRVTRTGDNLYYPYVSPDGRRVSFTAIDSLGQRVGLAPAEGGEVRYVTDVDDQAADPYWLPSGGIVYSSERGGARDLWVSDLTGPGSRLFALEGDEWAPRIAPGGDRILFSTDLDGDGEVYSARLDGSDARNLSNDPETWDGVPTWSPTGRQVAYYSRVLPDIAGPRAARESWGTAEIRLLDLDGRVVRSLTSNRVRDQSPSWSPDGRTIAYASCATGGLEVWAMSPEGKNSRRLTHTVETADSAAIATTLRDYVEGWRDGDVTRLSTALAPEGVIHWMSDDELRSTTFAEALVSRRPNPGYGEPWELRSLRIVDGQVAVAELMIAWPERSLEYTDLLGLHRFEDGWKIVSKIFSTRRD